MIRINLLPLEKRRTERVAIGRLKHVYITLAAVGLVALGGIFWMTRYWQVMGDLDYTKNALADLQSELKLKKYTEKKKRRDALNAQIMEIRAIVTRDVEWWESVDAVWDIVQNHPKIWIDSIRAMDFRAEGGTFKRTDIDDKNAPPVPYALLLKCHVAGRDVAEMTRFRNALKNDKTLQSTLTYININPDWKISEEDGYRESHSIAFEIGLMAPPPNKKPKVTITKAKPEGVPSVPPPPGGVPGVPPPPGGGR